MPKRPVVLECVAMEMRHVVSMKIEGFQRKIVFKCIWMELTDLQIFPNFPAVVITAEGF